jgi:hypothetical protein
MNLRWRGREAKDWIGIMAFLLHPTVYKQHI